jgi:hypothetical protein
MWDIYKIIVYIYAYIHTYIMEYSSAFKKKANLSFASTWMTVENIMLCEVSQVQRDKFRMISFIGGI